MVHDAKTHLLAILSGGIDSAVSLAMAIDLLKPKKVGAIHFDYGQRASTPETRAFFDLCNHFKIAEEDRYTFSLTPIKGSTLTHSDVPQQHLVADVPLTYVPNRNMVFIARAASHAIPQGFDALCIGVHEEDADYPDCSSAFVNAMKRALSISTAGSISLYAPVVKMSKAAIIKTGEKLHVPFGLTWTCYDPQWLNRCADTPVACGECPSCKLRVAAFAKNRMRDPLTYRVNLTGDLEAKEA